MVTNGHEMPANGFTITDGPRVNDEPTRVLLFAKPEFFQSPYVQATEDLINLAFATGSPPWIPATHKRLRTPEAFSDQLGDDDTFFYIIAATTTEGNPKLLACGGARPYHYIDPTNVYKDGEHFTRWDPEPSPGEHVWEPKFLCTDPSLQRQGLATYLLNLVEGEIKRRCTTAHLADLEVATGAGEGLGPGAERGLQRSGRVRIVLSTISQLNGGWYSKRGYRMTEERHVEKGVIGSEAGFSVWFGEKEV